MVPKPRSDKLRLYIAYRLLNSLARANSDYPLPHIPTLLQRLGEKRFKFADKMDYVSGYHQAMMDPAASEFASFVTADGVFPQFV